MTDIRQLVIAYDENLDVIHINDATKSGTYSCVECKSELIIKEGNLKIKHYSHKNNANCSPESIDHILTKKILKDYFESLDSYEFNYLCSECDLNHTKIIDLNNVRVELEYKIGPYYIDVAIVDENNEPLLAIEVFHTHLTDELKVDYIKQLKIPYIEIESLHHGILNKITNKLENPIKQSDTCITDNCESCGQRKRKTTVFVKRFKCWRDECAKENIVAVGKNFYDYSPEHFNSKEIEFAKENGVKLERRHSGTRKNSYLANICPHCDTFHGDFFITLETLYSEVIAEKDFVKCLNEECDNRE